MHRCEQIGMMIYFYEMKNDLLLDSIREIKN